MLRLSIGTEASTSSHCYGVVIEFSIITQFFLTFKEYRLAYFVCHVMSNDCSEVEPAL